MVIKTALLSAFAAISAGASAFAGVNVIEPDSGGDVTILLILLIGAVIVAASAAKPAKPKDPEPPKS